MAAPISFHSRFLKFGIILGACDEDDKGEGVWDHYVHTYSELIANNDIACNSYHKKYIGNVSLKCTTEALYVY